jgi:hypothetical protein
MQYPPIPSRDVEGNPISVVLGFAPDTGYFFEVTDDRGRVVDGGLEIISPCQLMEDSRGWLPWDRRQQQAAIKLPILDWLDRNGEVDPVSRMVRAGAMPL